MIMILGILVNVVILFSYTLEAEDRLYNPSLLGIFNSIFTLFLINLLGVLLILLTMMTFMIEYYT